MKALFPGIFLVVIFSCNSKEKQVNRLQHTATTAATIVLNYDSCKKEVFLAKHKNKAVWNKLSKVQKEKVFTTITAETIIPNWIGTAWDFNGTSEIPQKGSIACGYFVTTVLRDAGVSLARTKLAQCASEQMITSLIQSKYIRRFSNVTMDNFIQSIQKQGYGLYIVGLDNHTGLIYNSGKEIYFIHSTFVGTRNVQKEKAAASWVLRQSKYKVLGKISTDENILRKWIN
ncbi:hypothetical protein [Ferruginibacter sp.]|nr:hypothetical protein [Ferruginibacter sp.]